MAVTPRTDARDKTRLPQAFWRAAERAGLSAPALLRLAKLPATLPLQPQAPLSTAQYFALWRAVMALSQDPAIGLRMTLETETSGHPPATMAAFLARDYRDGLNRLARFKRLCTPEELTLTEAGGEARVTLRWLYADGPEPDAAADVTAAAVLELGRRGTRRPLAPVRVELTRREGITDRHRAYFDAPIRPGAAENAVILNRADLDLPFAGHNPDLLAILEPSLTETLRDIDGAPALSDQVRTLIRRSIASGKPDVAEVARELGLSERTLQRRIGDEGARFRDLLDEARQDLSLTLLSDRRNGVDEIAFLVGFQDTSSFYRAFRSWKGVTPAEWRARQ